MREVTEFVAALESVSSLFLEVRRPGLTPSELEVAARRLFPQGWVDAIDDEIRAWWGWQNGLDDQALAALPGSRSRYDDDFRIRLRDPAPIDAAPLGQRTEFWLGESIEQVVHPYRQDGLNRASSVLHPDGCRCRTGVPDEPRWNIIYPADEIVFPITASILVRRTTPDSDWTTWGFDSTHGLSPIPSTADEPSKPATFNEFLGALTDAIRPNETTTSI